MIIKPRLRESRLRLALQSLMILSLLGCFSSTRNDFGNSTRADSDFLMQSVLDCARSAIAKIDDGKSDASTVALALAQNCYAEYQSAINAFADVNLRNDAQRRLFIDKRNSVSGRIEFFLPVVMDYRHSSQSRSNQPQP